MKRCAGLIIFFGATIVMAQDSCEKDCDTAEVQCVLNNGSGCSTERTACHGKCVSKKCLRKTGIELFAHHEKCGCHGDCMGGRCQLGICCIPEGLDATSAYVCCSKKADELPLNSRGVTKRCL